VWPLQASAVRILPAPTSLRFARVTPVDRGDGSDPAARVWPMTARTRPRAMPSLGRCRGPIAPPANEGELPPRPQHRTFDGWGALRSWAVRSTEHWVEISIDEISGRMIHGE
jgi:hypothetical protein